MPYLAGKDSCYMQSAVTVCKKFRLKLLGQRRDVTRKFWASVIPGSKYASILANIRGGFIQIDISVTRG